MNKILGILFLLVNFSLNGAELSYEQEQLKKICVDYEQYGIKDHETVTVMFRGEKIAFTINDFIIIYNTIKKEIVQKGAQ